MAVHTSVLPCMFVGISIRVVVHVCVSHGPCLSEWVCSSAGFQQQAPGTLDGINICTIDRGAHVTKMAINSYAGCRRHRTRCSSVREANILRAVVQRTEIKPLSGVTKEVRGREQLEQRNSGVDGTQWQWP